MAPDDELRLELLPSVVTTGRVDCTVGTRPVDFDSLAEELVHQGVAGSDDHCQDLHSRVVDRVEREVIAQVLTLCDGVQIKAAERLGINRNTLHKKLKDYGLDGASP